MFTLLTVSLAFSSFLPDANISRGILSLMFVQMVLVFLFLLRITWLNAFNIPKELMPIISPMRGVFSVTTCMTKFQSIKLFFFNKSQINKI